MRFSLAFIQASVMCLLKYFRGFLQPSSVPCQWCHPSISLPLGFLLLDLCSQKRADITPWEDFIAEQSLPSTLCLCAHQRAASPSKRGPREGGLVQGSHKAKLASLVGFLLQMESGILDSVGHRTGEATSLWLTWTQLLLGSLLLPGGAGTLELPVELVHSEDRKLTKWNPRSWHYCWGPLWQPLPWL